jgi:hypothetical protein
MVHGLRGGGEAGKAENRLNLIEGSAERGLFGMTGVHIEMIEADGLSNSENRRVNTLSRIEEVLELGQGPKTMNRVEICGF